LERIAHFAGCDDPACASEQMNKWLCTLAAVTLLALIVWATTDDSAAPCSTLYACLNIGEAVAASDTSVKPQPVDRAHPHVATQLVNDNKAVAVSTAPQNDIAPRAPAKPVILPPADSTVARPISKQGDSGTAVRTTEDRASDVVDLADSGFEVTAMSGSVSVDWTTAHEVGVVNYLVDRRPQEAASYDLGVQVSYPQGEGALYSVVDRPPDTGTFIYRLRAIFTSGTEAILAEGSVTP